VRQWVPTALFIGGVLSLTTAVLVWWSADRSLGPAPEIHVSEGGSLSYCGYRPGQTSCDPPEVSTWTWTVIAALVTAGAAALAVGAVLAIRRRGADR
jgi:hypothetical protein